MDEKNELIIAQLSRIFESFLDPNFTTTTTNSVYFEKLITHLSTKDYEFVLRAPFAMQWVDKCLTLLTEDIRSLNVKVTSFMLNFFGMLTGNEWNIYEIRERNMVDRVRVLIERNMEFLTPSMKLGSIRLFAALSKYSLGSMYIRNTKAWKLFIEFCKKDHTLYVIREVQQLIYDLIYSWNTKAKDNASVLEILKEILKPIIEKSYDEKSEKIIINVDDDKLQQEITPSLELINFILQKILESEEKCTIPLLLQECSNFEIVIWKLTDLTLDQQFMEKILSVIVSYSYALLVVEEWTQIKIPPENFSKFGVVFFNIIRYCVTRRDFENFIKIAELNHVLWKKLGTRAPAEIQIEQERIRFEDQLIVLQLMPVLFILRSREFQYEEEFFDTYAMKLFHISCEQTLRICYGFRDVFLNDDMTSVQMISRLAYKAIHGILAMEKILERDQAVLVFQAMIYALKEFLHNSNHQNEPTTPKQNPRYYWNGAMLIREVPYILYALLIGLRKLIQRYNITWKDSIETICLVNTVAVIIENPNLSSRLAVQALKLIQLSIEHFLSPNMALLVDNLQGSGLVCLGPIITRRFHDNTWEVRDTTLELVTSIASISKIKFPAFQQFLVDYKICPIVYQMAKNDAEPYVRASALRCLSNMVALNGIWENDLSKLDLIEHILDVLYNESEGIVRIEAACIMCKIYDQRKIPPHLLDSLFSTMAHCVIADLHWEVKINALGFWRLEIIKQFTNQGMIDGTFPTVTFSKENKKIVTLTTKEINLRIKKILDILSQRGCLGIMLKCLKDECDSEVIKVVVCMVYKLLKMLKKYDYETILNSFAAVNENPIYDDSDLASLEKPMLDLPFIEDPANIEKSDEVIDGILSSQDIQLLQKTYERQMHLNGDIDVNANSKIDEKYYKNFANVDAKEFITAVNSMNLCDLVQSHEDWVTCTESFSSLLDDIKCVLKIQDENMISDCY